MRLCSCILVGVFCLLTFFSFKDLTPHSIAFHPVVEYFKTHATQFAISAFDLKQALSEIDCQKPGTITHARKALKACRLQYKRVEFFMEYFLKSNAVFYNGPPKFEVEEPFMEWQTPTGLQVIEALLFEKDVCANRAKLMEQVDALASSAQDLTALLYGMQADDRQILESLRLELVRIYTLGITGYDAPLLKTGIEEAAIALESVEFSLTTFLKEQTMHADSIRYYMKASLDFLHGNKDFDSFDRLTFLSDYALPLQKHLGSLIKELNLELNTTGNILNYDAPHLFSPNAININAFSATDANVNPVLMELGNKLFFEKALSGNNKISCATCHQPEKHFTDALPKSIAFDGHSTVKRNTSSLIYAVFQHNQFWDGRANSLEEQVKEVLANPSEMNSNPQVMLSRMQKDKNYNMLFTKAFPIGKDSLITINKIAIAIAAFVRSLHPINSPFDQFMQGNKLALTQVQKQGFNLFMGKAQCGTCHFVPLFNGLVPPLYNLTELEVIGTPKTDNLNKPLQDNDSGRYAIFPIEFYEQAFKTPTVRNVSATAPYMHNGSFKTLEKVVEFYNKGGGSGIGLSVKNQTLSSEPLHLTNEEVVSIVGFMQSLKDSIVY